MYVMTDKELIEVACDVLKQAGKEDLVKQFLSQQTEVSELKLDITDNTSNISKHEAKQKNKDTKETSVSKTKHPEKLTDISGDVGDQLGSFCPKMEPDFDSEDDDVTNDITVKSKNKVGTRFENVESCSDNQLNHRCKHDIADHGNKDMAACKDGNKDTAACKDKDTNSSESEDFESSNNPWEVQNVVSSVLEEFSTSIVPPKPSPRKRDRFKEDTPSTSTSEIKKLKFTTDNGDCKADKQYKPLDTISSGKKSTTRPTPDLSHLDEIF